MYITEGSGVATDPACVLTGGASFDAAFCSHELGSPSLLAVDIRTWLRTGASSGIGLALAEAALQAGERVVGTARRVDRFDALRARYGDRLVV